MKTIIKLFLGSIFALIMTGCGTSKNTSQFENEQYDIKEKLEKASFEFSTNYVVPMGNFPPRYLTSNYSVKLSGDTLYSYLPYFGVAYVAPINSSDSPLIFTTKDFDYQLTKGKKAGNWNVKIDVKDKRKQLRYILNIYNNGKADLIVNDFSRQSIRFQGEIEK